MEGCQELGIMFTSSEGNTANFAFVSLLTSFDGVELRSQFLLFFDDLLCEARFRLFVWKNIICSIQFFPIFTNKKLQKSFYKKSTFTGVPSSDSSTLSMSDTSSDSIPELADSDSTSSSSFSGSIAELVFHPKFIRTP
jgi:hypothetical protein